eukprot:scaffold23310_cov155-Skeletonema_dohrnii-CCMP3373.AAC.1
MKDSPEDGGVALAAAVVGGASLVPSNCVLFNARFCASAMMLFMTLIGCYDIGHGNPILST